MHQEQRFLERKSVHGAELAGESFLKPGMSPQEMHHG
jgi:hypothetical protein